ncbi:MAG: hypothetical protein ABI870_14260 [Rhodanobacter sp.]
MRAHGFGLTPTYRPHLTEQNPRCAQDPDAIHLLVRIGKLAQTAQRADAVIMPPS